MDFLIVLEFFEDSGGYQAVVRMVGDDLGTEEFHDLIEEFREQHLQRLIACTFLADGIDDLIAFFVSFEHFIDRADIVLSVAIQRNGHIAAVLGFHQSCQQGVLMSAVTG